MSAVSAVPVNLFLYFWLPLFLIFFCMCILIGLTLALLLLRKPIDRKTSGAFVLALASIVLIGGLWSIYLSPTSTEDVRKMYFQDVITIEGNENATFPVTLWDGDYLLIEVTTNPRFENPAPVGTPFFNIYLLNPQGRLICLEEWTRWAGYEKRLAYGQHTVDIMNPNDFDIKCFVTLIVTGIVEYRALAPIGSLLTLMSLPIFGFGVWFLFPKDGTIADTS